MTAAMTGLRQGELLALRWRDIDRQAAKIHVRRNYVRGDWLTPKSGKARAVPMAPSLADALDRHFKQSNYTTDDDLVFAHPNTGKVLDHSRLNRRFKAALKQAKVREVRFHDLRHADGERWLPAASAAIVDGSRELDNDGNLCRLRTERP
jgi:integrase